MENVQNTGQVYHEVHSYWNGPGLMPTVTTNPTINITEVCYTADWSNENLWEKVQFWNIMCMKHNSQNG